MTTADTASRYPDGSSADWAKTALGYQPGDLIGGYKLLSTLGVGGFGVVYLAEQSEPIKRRVALKVIKPGMDTRTVIARFEAERQALALMDHPNVARVFDGGATEDGRPFFVMEHVKGVPITEYCDREKLPTQARLSLFVDVCHAVQHAHQKGIIHRDIKPSNVLVMIHDSKPVPKVIDFGVARATNRVLTEKSVFTEINQLIGTPQYMSPEQAEMTGLDIDTRSDVYSLGVLLYELLTGTTPFSAQLLRSAALNEIQRVIREEDPRKPSTRLTELSQAFARAPGTGAGINGSTPQTERDRSHARDDAESFTSIEFVASQRGTDPTALRKQLRGDLDWIVLKTLEKDRTRRYETANGLAEDIRRHLRSEPVTAGPPSVVYRARKFIRRNQTAVAAAALVLFVIIAGITGTSWGLIRANTAMLREHDAKMEAVDRAEALESITEFQNAMLSEVDTQMMGLDILADQRRLIEESMRSTGAADEDISAALDSFDGMMRELNPTDVALHVVNKHILARAVKTIESEMADQPLTRASLQQSVANTYHAFGLFEAARPLQVAALRTRRVELGDDHRETLDSIGRMGALLQSIGEYEEALGFQQERLARSRRVFGDNSRATLAAIHDIGWLHFVMEAHEDAEDRFREALDGYRREFGDDDRDTLDAMISMGRWHQFIGNHDAALTLYRNALKSARPVLGTNHPTTLDAIGAIGSVLTQLGRAKDAVPYSRELLESQRRTLGNEHPATLTSMSNLGFNLRFAREYDDAESLLVEALEGRRRVLGDDHPSTLWTLSHLGSVYQAMENYDKAEHYLREVLRHRRRVLGNEDRITLRSVSELGGLLYAASRYEDAMPYYREALDVQRRIFGEDDPRTHSSIHKMGELLRELGRLEEAEAYGAEAVRRAREMTIEPGGPGRIGIFLSGYGETLSKMNRYTEAEAALLEAYAIHGTERGGNHTFTIDVVELLVALYDAWHQANPENSHDVNADQWRAILEQYESNEPRALPQASTPDHIQDGL